MIIVRFAENDFCTIQINDLTEGHIFLGNEEWITPTSMGASHLRASGGSSTMLVPM